MKQSRSVCGTREKGAEGMLDKGRDGERRLESVCKEKREIVDGGVEGVIMIVNIVVVVVVGVGIVGGFWGPFWRGLGRIGGLGRLEGETALGSYPGAPGALRGRVVGGSMERRDIGGRGGGGMGVVAGDAELGGGEG